MRLRRPQKRKGALPESGADWRTYFARFSDVVLVANSDAVDIAALEATFGEDTLFVFFNKVYKVLDRPFARSALLLARSSAAGANIVYRREVGRLLGYFDPNSFEGFLNLRAAGEEAFSPADAFDGRPVGTLDLVGHFDGFYSAEHVPSSGFALAVWLVEQETAARVHLAGFTGQRGERWKIFRVHDWTFEQTVQRLLVAEGRLHVAGSGVSDPGDPVARIVGRFPGIGRDAVLSAASAVLTRRLDDGDAATDELIALTRPLRTIRRILLRLKPRTRKQRLADGRLPESGAKPEGEGG